MAQVFAVQSVFYTTTAYWRLWNCRLFKPGPRVLLKPVKRKACEVVTKLMLMLVQVNAFHNSHYQTVIKRSTVHPKQVEYDNSLLRQI